MRQDCSWQHPFRALCQGLHGFLSFEDCRAGVAPPLYFQSSCVSAVIMSHPQISCSCPRETFTVDDIIFLVMHLWVLVGYVGLIFCSRRTCQRNSFPSYEQCLRLWGFTMTWEAAFWGGAGLLVALGMVCSAVGMGFLPVSADHTGARLLLKAFAGELV